MRAALIKDFKKEFAVEEVDIPRLNENEALVKVKASCICASDLRLRDGRVPGIMLPHIPGHEVVGEVVEIGRIVKKVKVGDRVVVYMYEVCGDCYACRSGRENLCVNIVRLGFNRQGGHAEYVAIPESQLLELPGNIPYEEGAAIPDAVSTMLHAIRDQGQVKINEYVVIMGVGGLGIHGVQIGRLCGGRVIAVARSEEKLEVARGLGAEWAMNGNDEKLADKIVEVTNGRGVDVMVDLVVTQETFQTAAKCLKNGGTIIIVGLTLPEITFTVGQVMVKEIAIKGSIGMKKQAVIDAIDLRKSGKIKTIVTERYPLEGINEAAKRIEESKVVGRSVILP